MNIHRARSLACFMAMLLSYGSVFAAKVDPELVGVWNLATPPSRAEQWRVEFTPSGRYVFTITRQLPTGPNSWTERGAFRARDGAYTWTSPTGVIHGQYRILDAHSVEISGPLGTAVWHRIEQSLSSAARLPVQVRKAKASRLFEQGARQAQNRQFEAARTSWRQALDLYQQLGDRRNQGRTLINLGSASAYQGQFEPAGRFYREALNIAQVIGDRITQAQALAGLGNSYFAQGQYQRAIESQQQAVALARAIDDSENAINALSGLGSIYDSLGLSRQAIPYYQQALDLAEKSRDRAGIIIAQGNLGIAHGSIGDYPRAKRHMEQALRLAQQQQDTRYAATAANGLGSLFLKQRQYAEAARYYQQGRKAAQSINDTQTAAIALTNLAIAYGGQKQFPQAIQTARQAVDLARSIGDRQSETDALNNLGLAFYWSGQPAAAEAPLLAAIQVRESLRTGLSNLHKISIIDTQQNAYLNLQKVLIALNKTGAALEISERARARAFVELLLKQQADAAIADSIPILTLQQIRQVARDHRATLVEYSIIHDEVENRLLIWVVKPTGEVVFRQVDLKSQPIPLRDLVTRSRESIGVRGRGARRLPQPTPTKPSTDPLQTLHQLLIEPIADLLPTDPEAPVVFIPQGVLFLVPFPALHDASGKLLIERHTPLTAPSIQVLQLTYQQRQRNKTGHRSSWQGSNALIVGNPTMPQIRVQAGGALKRLPPLPGAKQEAREIAALLNSSFLTGDQATKAAVLERMPQARLVHLATHGLLDDFVGLGIPGAVALAPAGKDSGLLTANEILKLRLGAELVVLSACDTGRGRITGDGVVGLSRSLVSAGAPSVLASLWSIPDAPTAVLMKQFYLNLRENPNKARALRQAMLSTRQRFPRPVHWAAFTLIGEAE